MCFSAGASFTAGALLTAVGVQTIRKVHKPSQLVFAGIPIFFALQQFSEGVLWLCIGRPELAWLQSLMTHIFIAMAQSIWPVMVPLSVLLMEEDKTRKKILYYMLGLGGIITLYNTYVLIFCNVTSEVSAMHIMYQSTAKFPSGIWPVILYIGAALVPLFVSSIKRMHVLGTIMALSFIVSFVFYTKCLTSVWCFFAALMSFMVYYIVNNEYKKSILHKIQADSSGL